MTVVLSACGGGGAALLNSSSTIVTVDGGGGAPLSGVIVTLSSGVDGVSPVGVIATATTNALGFVTFTLPPASPLCVSAALAARPPVVASECRSAPFPSSVTLRL